MGLYALGDAHQAWVLLLNAGLRGRLLHSVCSASFRLVRLGREPLGLPGNNHTRGILMAESNGPEIGVGNSKWETLV